MPQTRTIKPEVVFEGNANAFAERITTLPADINEWAGQANLTKDQS